MGQLSNSFPKHFSYLCEYAIQFDLSCSFCEYPFIFHCLHCSRSCFDPLSLLLAYLWLGLSWIDCISANKSFSSSKTSSRKPYTSSKQQERQKHSVEITINFSRAPCGMLCDCVLRFPRGQVDAVLGQWASREMVPCFRLLQVPRAYGVLGWYVYAFPAVPPCYSVKKRQLLKQELKLDLAPSSTTAR